MLKNLNHNIIFEDEQILVLNKPANIPVQSTHAGTEATLLEMVEEYYTSLGRKQYLRLIHRLDKGTSGVIIFSKSAEANKSLTDQFRAKSVAKEYIAIAIRKIKEKSGTIDTFIRKVRSSHVRYECTETAGKHAVTHYELTRELKGHSLLLIRPETGRTHQIRVHLAHIGHPILGDKLYGGRERVIVKSAERLIDMKIERVMLHAASINFMHPKTKKMMTRAAELPDDMQEIINLLS